MHFIDSFVNKEKALIFCHLKAYFQGIHKENSSFKQKLLEKICSYQKKSYLCIAFETRDIGRLAQLVQSICLTSRGSAVRIRQRPQRKLRKCEAFSFSIKSHPYARKTKAYKFYRRFAPHLQTFQRNQSHITAITSKKTTSI